MMIDITGPKVLVPTILFGLLTPGLVLDLDPVIHISLFVILYWVIINFGFKFTISRSDLVASGILFWLLLPGTIATFPPVSDSVAPVMVHTFIYAIVWAMVRSSMPDFF